MKIECETCSGLGWVFQYRHGQEVEVPCPTCNGSGYLEVETEDDDEATAY